jgi:hypothetical protein
MAKSKKNKIVIILVVLVAVVLFIYRRGQNFAQPIVNEQEAVNQEMEETDSQDIQSIVESYMNATLGTLPNANIDYDKARSMMTQAYAKKFDSPMFVPQAYGMQDGPDRVAFESKDIMGDQAEVVMMGYWGDNLQMRWKFEFEREAGEWKISFINPGQ